MSNVKEEVSEHLRCAHCKGPVHECLDTLKEWWCILCGVTQTFDIRDRQRKPCTQEGCEYGAHTISASSKTCGRCRGTGLEFDDPMVPA